MEAMEETAETVIEEDTETAETVTEEDTETAEITTATLVTAPHAEIARLAETEIASA